MAMTTSESRAKGGRPVLTAADALTWEQRIQREEIVNARALPKFSLRNAVTVLDVPTKFKVGHVDPAKEIRDFKPFDPADNGWDPQGADAKEFKRVMKQQAAGPRDRQAYPLTSYQEHGWLLAPQGDPADRVRHKKVRLGFGWEWKPPDQYSASTAMPPPLYLAGDSAAVGHHEAAGSALSVSAPLPPAPSSFSASPPTAASSLSAAPPPCVSAARASRLSASAPASELTGSCSSLSRATSLPALGEHPADTLHRREKKLASVMEECLRFQKRGDRGQRYDRPLGTTDATQFDDDFTKAAGMPLYKAVGPQVVTLKDPRKNVLVPKWR